MKPRVEVETLKHTIKVSKKNRKVPEGKKKTHEGLISLKARLIHRHMKRQSAYSAYT